MKVSKTAKVRLLIVLPLTLIAAYFFRDNIRYFWGVFFMLWAQDLSKENFDG